jgi:hypothetical protein
VERDDLIFGGQAIDPFVDACDVPGDGRNSPSRLCW